MEYLIGLLLCVAVAGFATAIGLDRERGFYPPVVIVIASYYALFAVMGASRRTLVIETAVASAFVVTAALASRKAFGSRWLPSLATEFLTSSITGSLRTLEYRIGGLVSV